MSFIGTERGDNTIRINPDHVVYVEIDNNKDMMIMVLSNGERISVRYSDDIDSITGKW